MASGRFRRAVLLLERSKFPKMINIHLQPVSARDRNSNNIVVCMKVLEYSAEIRKHSLSNNDKNFNRGTRDYFMSDYEYTIKRSLAHNPPRDCSAALLRVRGWKINVIMQRSLLQSLNSRRYTNSQNSTLKNWNGRKGHDLRDRLLLQHVHARLLVTYLPSAKRSRGTHGWTRIRDRLEAKLPDSAGGETKAKTGGKNRVPADSARGEISR